MPETRMELRRCPVCDCAMKPITRHGVVLDRCPFEHGLWFDRGELEEVARREGSFLSESGVAAKLAPRLAEQNCPKCGTATLLLGRFETFRVGHCETCYGLFLPTESIRKRRGRDTNLFDRVVDGIGVLEIIGWAAAILD